MGPAKHRTGQGETANAFDSEGHELSQGACPDCNAVKTESKLLDLFGSGFF